MKRTTTGIVLAVALVLLAATKVQAAAVATPFTATFTSAPAGDPERTWTDEDGILHVRDQPFAGTITGDIAGTVSFLANVNIDPATGSGDLFGPFTITIAQGTFSGRFSGTISGGLGSGEFVGKSADGTKIMGTFVEGPPGTEALSGVILSPKG